MIAATNRAHAACRPDTWGSRTILEDSILAHLHRRTFLKGAADTAGAIALGPFQAFAGLANAAGKKPDFQTLGPVADLRDNKVRLHLPPGFEYRSFHDTDGPPIFLTDATLLPGRHDGMAAFPAGDGNSWLLRNHELPSSFTPWPDPVPASVAFGPGTPYDARGRGGTTTVLVTPFGEVLESFTSLNGTVQSCAGGGMPWGSWITCEETVNGPDVGPDFTGITNEHLLKPHGFIFEVPANGQSNRLPVKNAGRFAHEAAAFSPDEGYLYLTEDDFAFPSGFYRYIPPNDPMVDGHVEDGGQLQMLKVVGVDQAHLEAGQANGATYAVEWVDIAQPYPNFGTSTDALFTSPTTNDQALTFVGNQGRAFGAAHFSRLEGASYTHGEIYFTSTQGGGAAETGPELLAGYGNGRGQVWSYDPLTSTLTCRFQSPNVETLDFPDNITAKSDRGTIVLCEDGAAPNFIRGLARDGQLFDIALNRLTNNTTGAPRFGEEFAGATFGPGTDTMFVNIQASLGISFAIWGPWGRLGV
jgi:secreted PhoX family phosphatase